MCLCTVYTTNKIIHYGNVADPDPGSGAFLTPGSGILDPGSGMGNKSGSGSGSPETISWVKIFKFFDADLGSGIRNENDSDLGSGVRDPGSGDPQHCTTVCTVFVLPEYE
jgi:hypothetical protein